MVYTILITTGKASRTVLVIRQLYHSRSISSLFWMDHFGDPTYQYHVALTQIWGLMALHLSSDSLLHMTAKPYAVFIAEHYRSLKSLAPSLDFSNLESAISNFIDAADILDAEIHLTKEKRGGRKTIGDINSRLGFFERQFIDPEGIQGRDWFKHVIIG
jgi:Transferrin receptor-like dimerisation domain